MEIVPLFYKLLLLPEIMETDLTDSTFYRPDMEMIKINAGLTWRPPGSKARFGLKTAGCSLTNIYVSTDTHFFTAYQLINRNDINKPSWNSV